MTEQEIELHLKTVEAEVNLNRKEIMIAFKRLKDVEIRVEEMENKLRGK